MLGKERERQQTVADGKGLSVRISKTGAISFVFFFRLGGRESSPIWMTLGRYPDMSLKLAREQLKQCREWLAEGLDPRSQMKVSVEQTLRPLTIKDALTYWLENYAVTHRTPESYGVAEQRFEQHIFKYIGHVPLDKSTVNDWLGAFNQAKQTAPVACGNTLRDAKQALKYCRVRGIASSNILCDLGTGDVGVPQKKRDRIITDNELKDIWLAVTDSLIATPYTRNIIRICLVFGCRQREARLSSWCEWDLINWVWTVPKEHSKNRKEIIRPIPEGMRQFITDLHEATKNSDYILGKHRTQTDITGSATLLGKKLKHNQSYKWTMHDFRRVFATKLNDMGVDYYVVEQLLGHTMPGVMGIYNRSQYMQKKMDALNMWVNYINCVSGLVDNVVALNKVM